MNNDILYEILRHLPRYKYKQLCLVCKNFNKLMNTSILFNPLYNIIYMHRFPYLKNNKLKTLTNITKLNAIHFKITHQTLSCLTNLTKLCLSGVQKITDYTLKKLTYLRSLSLISVRDSNIGKSLSNLTNLKTLVIDMSYMIRDNDVSNLTNLKKLSIENGSITYRTLRCLPQLTYLNMSNNYNIGDKGLKKLTNLKTLIMNFDYMDDYFELTDRALLNLNLTHLDISNNSFITNQGISHLTNLTTLDISENDITDEGIENMIHLKNLYFYANDGITNNGLKNLTNLQSLYFFHHDAITFTGLQQLPLLTDVDMHGLNDTTYNYNDLKVLSAFFK